MKLMKAVTLLLAAALFISLSGCNMRALGRTLDAAEDNLEARMDMAEEKIEDAVQSMAPATVPDSTPEGAALTKEQAQSIALQHAGFTADQVKYLRTDYKIDDGIPQYEVEFHQDRWEYNYEINADTGAIISFEKDD